MKNKQTIIILILLMSVAVFFSCDIALGPVVNMNGPIVQINTPLARQPVDGAFLMTGTVEAVNSSTLSRMLIRITFNTETEPGSNTYENIEYCAQWQHTSIGWRLSGDHGKTWQEIPGIVINGETKSSIWLGDNKKADWEVPIDMKSFENTPCQECIRTGKTRPKLLDGQYMFSATAWDNIGNSDENSYITRTVIFNSEPPIVKVIFPELAHKEDLIDPESEFYKLDEIQDHTPEALNMRRSSANLGKFITGEIEILFQIDSNADVWAVDIRLYEKDKLWATSEEEDFVYRTFINDMENRPPVPDLKDTLHPFYHFYIPDLSGAVFAERIIDADRNRKEELKKSLTDKTTLRVVIRCMDASGLEETNEIEEREHGLLIFWPDADIPWLELPDVMKEVHSTDDIYTVFPNSVIPIRAFDNNGIDRIEYELWRVNPLTGISEERMHTGIETDPAHPRIFSWAFEPPPISGHYFLKATIFDYVTPGVTSKTQKSATFSGFFQIVDLSFPEIDPPVNPVGSSPMFYYIKTDPNITAPNIEDWYVDIIGYAFDNNKIDQVSMVWINPRSRAYAAMSQLAFFRDEHYGSEAKGALAAKTYGWYMAPSNPLSPPGRDIGHDPDNPNLVWNMELSTDPAELQVSRNDIVYNKFQYKKRIYLKELNIAPGMMWTSASKNQMVQVPHNMTADERERNKDLILDYLKSQVFVIKASDDDDKSTIIIWSPQGDSRPPTVTLTRVITERYNSQTSLYYPPEVLSFEGIGAELPLFSERDRITIEGTWTEDSAASGIPNFEESFLKRNLRVSINNIDVPKDIFYDNPNDKSKGTWKSVVTVEAESAPQGTVKPGNLLDTLVIYANIVDLGGNPSENTASWLIASQKLRLLRIGSNTPDGFFRVDNEIEIFIDFNKPVVLANPASPPSLHLNTTGGIPGFAEYDTSHPNYNPAGNVRQYFKYKVANGQNSSHLNVNAISSVTRFNSTIAGDDDYLDVSHTTDDLLARLPVTTDRNQITEYMRTLMGAKTFRIDTTPLRAPDISRMPNTGFMRENETIFITLTFTTLNGEPDPIMIGVEPALRLNIRNTGGGDTRAFVTTENVTVNNNRLIFSYQTKTGDYSGNSAGSISAVQVLGLDNNTITDLAGNAFTAIIGIPQTYTGLFVDTIQPVAPTVRMVTNDTGIPTGVGSSNGSTPPWSNPNILIPGTNELGTVFYSNLEIEITVPLQASGKTMAGFVEFSTNNGRSWSPHNIVTPGLPFTFCIPVPNSGLNQITVRIVDRAGNRSNWLVPITFTWDDGVLLELVTTSASNGIKTNTIELGLDRQDEIPIVMTFRHPVEITAAQFNLNIGNRLTESAPYTRIFNPFTEAAPAGRDPSVMSSADKKTWTFTYYVKPTDTTGTGVNLAIRETNTFFTATLLRETISPPGFVNTGVDVSSMLNLNPSNNRLDLDKEIIVQTGFPELEDGYPRFETGTSPDGISYNTFLSIRFKQRVSRGGVGSISIIQQSAGYRLPAVLTETERSRYRPILNSLMDTSGIQPPMLPGEFIFDRYYDRGTNGYNPTTNTPDTSVKYILKFEHDTYAIVPNSTGTYIQRFAEAMRQAESINIPINSSAITIQNDYEIRVNLTGANALKVIGANYIVSFTGGIVFNEAGSPNSAYNSTDAGRIHTTSIRAARPTIRLLKTQESIVVRQANATTARIHAEQPGQAQIMMDSRTPSSRVVYIAQSASVGNNTAVSWIGAGTDPSFPVSFPASAGMPTAPAAPTAINTGTINKAPAGGPVNGTRYLFGRTDTGLEPSLGIGPAAEASGLFQGFKFRIRAAGMVNNGGNASDFSSIHAEEVAFRTVIVFQGVNVPNFYSASHFGSGAGHQLWIRGGNTINSTTIPGFPLTITDNWTNLQVNRERAGIRLMSKTSGTAGNNLEASTWQYVSWDINAVTYYDIYIGYDDTPVNLTNPTEVANFQNRIFQYGPRYFSRNTGEWTTLKQYYAAVPGERRWLSNNAPTFTRQTRYSFNSSFSERPDNMITTIP